MKTILRVVVTAVALWVATLLVNGISISSDTSTVRKVVTLLGVAIIFGLVNGFLKPIIKSVGCAFYVLTLGLVALIVNGVLLELVSWLSGKLSLPFHVADFWPAAVLGAIVIGVVSWLLNMFVHDEK